jgi:hypothetical protein
MAAALPLILAGGQAYMSNQQNEMAGRKADDAKRGQDELLKEQLGLFKMMKETVLTMDKLGQFDPEKQIAQLDKDVSKNQGRDMGNLGAGLSAAGYRPGDSEIGTRMDAIALKHRDYRDRLATDIRANAATQKLNAYGMLNGGQLNPGIGAYGNRMESVQQPPSSAEFYQALMPFFNSQNKPIQKGFNLPGPADDEVKKAGGWDWPG